MRAAIESWLLERWYSTNRPPWYLRLVEFLYRFIFRLSQNKSDKYHAASPLVVIGNLTAGGTGKTPLVIRLCELAGELGLKVGIASTGYGRSGRHTMLVTVDSNVADCGDEPLLLAHRTGCPVVVARRRVDAVRALCETGVEMVFSDDGLQTAGLHRDLEICVVDGERGLGNGHLLPAGPLREAAERLWSVDHVISNGAWHEKPRALTVHEMELQPIRVCSLDGQSVCSVEEFARQVAGKKIAAVAAIGHPQRFFGMLEKLGIVAETFAFPDHHHFSNADFSALDRDTRVVMTEKDAVKCKDLEIQDAWYIPVDTRLPAEFEHIIKKQLASLTGDDN